MVKKGVVVLSLLGLILPVVFHGNACAEALANGGPLIYATDRTVYTQGDVVKISVTNTSGKRSAITVPTPLPHQEAIAFVSATAFTPTSLRSRPSRAKGTFSIIALELPSNRAAHP
jgi:hypothetical protein